tara:strand:+ start:752 stop:1030 length:279 start_codon:yes stop_codon:yes gene_type:complete
MTKTKISNPQSKFVDNDLQYEIVPRRRSERRSVNYLQGLKSELAAENKDIDVQNTEKKLAAVLIEDERRQSARRTSRPTLLSAVEISKLRKK